VRFTDGTTADGTHLVGCDGARSKVKEILCTLAGKDPRNNRLDVRFLGCSVNLPLDVAERMRQLDPFFFQGRHPNGSFLFFGILETPVRNEQQTYKCQINVSWPYKKGFFDRDDATDIPSTQEDRLEWINELAKYWISPFQDAIKSIPKDTLLQEIKLEDWVPSGFPAWNNLDGRATLVGDAAHAMTMYRGEAANHGITDVCDLLIYLEKLGGSDNLRDWANLCSTYEMRMIQRTTKATLASRKACIDAHYLPEIDPTSPLVTKRAINIA